MGAQGQGCCPLLPSSCSALGSTCLRVGLYFPKALALVFPLDFFTSYQGSFSAVSGLWPVCGQHLKSHLADSLQWPISLAYVTFTLLSR